MERPRIRRRVAAGARFEPLLPLLPLDRDRFEPGLKILSLGLPTVPFAAEDIQFADADFGGFEPSLEAGHPSDLDLEYADLLAEPVAFGLLVLLLPSEDLDLLRHWRFRWDFHNAGRRGLPLAYLRIPDAEHIRPHLHADPPL